MLSWNQMHQAQTSLQSSTNGPQVCIPGVITTQTVGLITPTCLGISAILALPGKTTLTLQDISLPLLGQAEAMMGTHQCLMLVQHPATQMEAPQEEAPRISQCRMLPPSLHLQVHQLKLMRPTHRRSFRRKCSAINPLHLCHRKQLTRLFSRPARPPQLLRHNKHRHPILLLQISLS